MAVAVALAYLALSIVQEELRLILTGGFPTLLLGLLLSIVERRRPLVTFSHHCPLITVGRDVNMLFRHNLLALLHVGLTLRSCGAVWLNLQAVRLYLSCTSCAVGIPQHLLLPPLYPKVWICEIA